MVRKLLTITVSLTALSVLSACGHVHGWGGDSKDQIQVRNAPGAETVVSQPVAPMPRMASDMRVAPAPTSVEPVSVAPVEQTFPVPNQRDLFVLSDKLGNSSVEIYDPETAMPYGSRGGQRGGNQYTSGGASVATVTGVPMVSSTDSSVDIYPVDGSYAGSMDGTWPNSLYPTSSGMTPLGGGSQQASAGRASPRVGSGYAPSQIFFKHGSSRIGSGDQQVLRQVADQAKFAPVERVRVEGHASTRTGVSDPVEAKIVNLKESMNRAFNVSSTLMREGVPAEKIQTTVWGDTKNTGDEANSRRVDIITGGQ